MRVWTMHFPWEEHDAPIEGELETEQVMLYKYKEEFYTMPQYFNTSINRNILWTGKI